MNTILDYSRMHLIRNLKYRHLAKFLKSFSFITLQFFQTLNVTPKRSSKIVKTDESFHINFVCEFGITFAVEVRLDKNILIYVLNNVI